MLYFIDANSFWSPQGPNMGETGSLLAHLGLSKSNPGLEIFVALNDEKIHIRSINELKADQK